MHAREAVSRGWEVVHLEADGAPRRASVRNFGLVWVSGRAGGPELDLALRSRDLWEHIASESPGIGFRPDGSLTLAVDDAEVALLAEAAAREDAGAREIEFLDPSAVRDVNPAVKGEVTGGLWCRRDAVVEPGTVLGAIRHRLDLSGRYRWLPGHNVVDVLCASAKAATGSRSPSVIDQRGERHEGTRVILCVGDRLSGIGGPVGAALAEAPLKRCRLQMMQTAPTYERLLTAIADADSMRYYPAFDLPGRAALPPPRPETAAWAMQLLLVQRADGSLTIGDTHLYDEPFDFAVDETPYRHLRDRAESLLGWEFPPVVRRWSGVYSLVTDDALLYRRQVADAVWVVTGPAGRGMTLSPGIAEQTWEMLGT